MKNKIMIALVSIAVALADTGCMTMFQCGTEDERVARAIVDWLEENVGEEVKVSGTNGVTILKTRVFDFPAQYCGFYLELSVDRTNRIVRCESLIPLTLGLQKLKEEDLINIREFVSRAERKYGPSPATLTMMQDGDILCRSSLPFEEMLQSPEAANERLIGSVMDKCHALCVQFLFAQPPTPDDAQYIREPARCPPSSGVH